MKYTVYLIGSADATVEVDAPTPEEAQELAHDKMPPSLCHHCSGGSYGVPGLDLGDEFTATSVYDENSNEVMTGATDLDMLNKQVSDLRGKLNAVRALIDDNRLGETRLIPATELRAALDA